MCVNIPERGSLILVGAVVLAGAVGVLIVALAVFSSGPQPRTDSLGLGSSPSYRGKDKDFIKSVLEQVQ